MSNDVIGRHIAAALVSLSAGICVGIWQDSVMAGLWAWFIVSSLTHLDMRLHDIESAIRQLQDRDAPPLQTP